MIHDAGVAERADYGGDLAASFFDTLAGGRRSGAAWSGGLTLL
jgi:hypothetical protein